MSFDMFHVFTPVVPYPKILPSPNPPWSEGLRKILILRDLWLKSDFPTSPLQKGYVEEYVENMKKSRT